MPSGGDGPRCDQQHLMALLVKLCHLVYKGRDHVKVQAVGASGQEGCTRLDDDARVFKAG